MLAMNYRGPHRIRAVDKGRTENVPNVFKEMGGPAEWRHNRAGFVKKAMAVDFMVPLAVRLLLRGDD